MKKFIAIYSLLLGISIIGMWIMILSTSTIPEGKTEFTFHIFSEFLMAFMCILSGIHILLNHRKARISNTVAFGMVIYSVLNAAGYYGERNNVPMMFMFIGIFVLTVTALILNFKDEPARRNN